ncbi:MULTISPECIES: response regulator transcription factor [unclassified Lentimonas]|uniref:LuxR C-terminal-related transcriptional regulator n=1 Tax=unclassified Lentimonas TaxID=2630993 RepID=UPI0013283CD6|nr:MULTISPECIES: response regulator transcription factor [unclassified Lentimonas]CAA6689998.1 Nitrate/nitrite response regulator protein [Lentimonas sp. CC10]CAA6691073.1 Nitrate/nitrite response regulator protein [Lentimonas sp. CC19]CAA7069313.1 Nitrate/nitrite response regulator protein [Lentimonas sp. CC11]
MNGKIKIMLVEDNREYRDVLTFALGNEDDFELISQFGNAEMALSSLRGKGTEELPDVILLDLHLPRMSGSEALPFFRQVSEHSEIIILTQSDREADVFHTLSLGASGYLLKSSTVPQIKHGIRQVVSGHGVLDAAIARYVINTLKARPASSATNGLLSDRELQTLELLADGLQKKEIAVKLNISYTTVNTHVKHVYEKLDVQNAPAAVRVAYQLGIF